MSFPLPAPAPAGSEESKAYARKARSEYYMYILTNSVRTLYAGVTNNLVRRAYWHRHKLVRGFTVKHNIPKLFYSPGV